VKVEIDLMACNSDERRYHDGLALLVVGILIAISGRFALCQTSSPGVMNPPAKAELSVQTPTYEVATIKPWDGAGYCSPLRVYIQAAFGISPNTTGWVIGPDWISSAKYVIRAKTPDSIQTAMQTMTAAERKKQVDLMMQSLLAERFKLKAHWETREMPQYQLVLAKGGPKLKENPDTTSSRGALGASAIRGTAAPMHLLIDLLESVPEIGGRVVIDKTGLTANYDFSLKWTPMDATAPTGGDTGGAPPLNAEGASLFTAIEEQLGLKLVWTKGPGQVLVIDHIERPTEN
jgi:uncharacterized protein (TIGR03435 family)